MTDEMYNGTVSDKLALIATITKADIIPSLWPNERQPLTDLAHCAGYSGELEDIVWTDFLSAAVAAAKNGEVPEQFDLVSINAYAQNKDTAKQAALHDAIMYRTKTWDVIIDANQFSVANEWTIKRALTAAGLYNEDLSDVAPKTLKGLNNVDMFVKLLKHKGAFKLQMSTYFNALKAAQNSGAYTTHDAQVIYATAAVIKHMVDEMRFWSSIKV